MKLSVKVGRWPSVIRMRPCISFSCSILIMTSAGFVYSFPPFFPPVFTSIYFLPFIDLCFPGVKHSSLFSLRLLLVTDFFKETGYLLSSTSLSLLSLKSSLSLLSLPSPSSSRHQQQHRRLRCCLYPQRYCRYTTKHHHLRLPHRCRCCHRRLRHYFSHQNAIDGDDFTCLRPRE